MRTICRTEKFFTLGWKYQKEVFVFVNLVFIIDSKNDVVRPPQMTLKFRPYTTQFPQMFEDIQSLITVSEQLIELNKEIF